MLLIPFFGRFIWPLAVAGLGFKYSVTNSLDRFGHPFKKPFRKACIRLEIFWLHIDWWANLTAFARVLTECVNMATSTSLSCGVIIVGNCGARAIQGLAHDWADTTSCPWEVRSFSWLIASGVIGKTHRSMLGSLYPVKITFP